MPATYDFECGECGPFEKFYRTIPKRDVTKAKCECGRFGKRVPSLFTFKDEGWDQKAKKKKGSMLSDRTYAEEFTEEHLKRTKARMEGAGRAHYSRYEYNPDKDTRKDAEKPRLLNDDEFKEKIKKAKDLTIDAHKRAGKEDDLGRPKI